MPHTDNANDDDDDDDVTGFCAENDYDKFSKKCGVWYL